MSKEIKVMIFGDSDEEISVTAEFIPGCKGIRDAYGQKIEPDEDDSISILDALDQDGTSRNLSNTETQRAEDAIWDKISE